MTCPMFGTNLARSRDQYLTLNRGFEAVAGECGEMETQGGRGLAFVSKSETGQTVKPG